MSNDENASKQAEADASPNVEPDHVEGASTADNPPPTAGPNDSFLDEKSKLKVRVEQLKLELARKDADHIRKQATFDKRVTGYKDTVANQRNRNSKLELDRKATEAELKAKLRSAQLAAKENIGSLLARVSGSKNETAKAKRDLLDSTKSLSQALKTVSGSGKKVIAHELTIAHLQNDLAIALSNLKDATREKIQYKKQLDKHVDAKHQLKLSLAKIDLKKQQAREQEKKRKRDDVHKHRLTEIAAREASSKRVKDTANSHKTRNKERALETSTQRVQTMLETYNGTNSGQFPNGRTNLENVSSPTMPTAYLLHTANSPYCSSTMIENRLSRT
jgi:hypothetical protein